MRLDGKEDRSASSEFCQGTLELELELRGGPGSLFHPIL